MNLSKLTDAEVAAFEKSARRVGWNRLANFYFYELMRRCTPRAKGAA